MRPALAVGIVVVATLVIVGVVIQSTDRTPSTPLPGDALDLGNDLTVEAPLAPGQEVVDMFGSIENSSEAPLVLRSITPLASDGVPGIGEVIGVFLVGQPFQGSLYNTMPPVMRVTGKCEEGEPAEVDGFILDPGEQVLVATHVAARAQGRFELDGRAIVYEQNGKTYKQTDPYRFIGTVDPSNERELAPAERSCRAETNLLPSG